METVFETSFEYKLIYVFAINDEAHKGLLKIGDTTIQSDASIDALFPNCKALNQAALSRIKQYTNTAGISAQLLHTELAVRLVKGKDGQQVPEMTDEVVAGITNRYVELYEHIVGEKLILDHADEDISARIEKNVANYLG